MNRMMLHTILLCCLCMVSCSDSEGNEPILPPDQEQEEPDTPDRPQDYTGLMNKTNPVPAVYEQEAEHEYEGLPHGFGYTHEAWMVNFDNWMTEIMANN